MEKKILVFAEAEDLLGQPEEVVLRMYADEQDRCVSMLRMHPLEQGQTIKAHMARRLLSVARRLLPKGSWGPPSPLRTTLRDESGLSVDGDRVRIECRHGVYEITVRKVG